MKQKCTVVRGEEKRSRATLITSVQAAADAFTSAPVVFLEQAGELFVVEVEEFSNQRRASLSGTAIRPQSIQEE